MATMGILISTCIFSLLVSGIQSHRSLIPGSSSEAGPLAFVLSLFVLFLIALFCISIIIFIQQNIPFQNNIHPSFAKKIISLFVSFSVKIKVYFFIMILTIKFFGVHPWVTGILSLGLFLFVILTFIILLFLSEIPHFSEFRYLTLWISRLSGEIYGWLESGWRPPVVRLSDVLIIVWIVEVLFYHLESSWAEPFLNATLYKATIIEEPRTLTSILWMTVNERLFGFTLIEEQALGSNPIFWAISGISAVIWLYWKEIIGIWFLLEVVGFAQRASHQLVIEEVVDYTNHDNKSYDFEKSKSNPDGKSSDEEKSKSITFGLSDLLRTKLVRISELYRFVDEQRAIPSEPGAGRPIDATIKAEDVSGLLTSTVSTDSKFELGPFSIPASTVAGLIGLMLRGPRIVVGLHVKEEDDKNVDDKEKKKTFFLTAHMTSGKKTYSWFVDSPEPLDDDNHSQKTRTIDDMVTELAQRIFANLSSEGSDPLPWKAAWYFNEGLRAYRDCLHTNTRRRFFLKKAEKNFIESLGEKDDSSPTYYNLGVVYTELEQKDAAEAAFSKAIETNRKDWQAYYALALNIFERYKNHEDSEESSRGHNGQNNEFCKMRPIKTPYKFSWDEIPKKDEERFKKFLANEFDIDWAEAAIVEKIDHNNALKLSNENKSLMLKRNDKNFEVILEIDGRTCKFIAELDNDIRNIYWIPEDKELIKKRYHEAVSLCRHVIRLLSDDASFLNKDYANLAKVHNLIGDIHGELSRHMDKGVNLGEAIKNCEIAVCHSWRALLEAEMRSDDVQNKTNIASECLIDAAFFHLNRYKSTLDGKPAIEAEKLLKQALSINPADANLYLELGRSYCSRKDRKYFGRAIEMYKSALQVSPEDSKFWAPLAKAYLRKEDRSKAQNAIDNIVLYGPKASSGVLKKAAEVCDEFNPGNSLRLRRAALLAELDAFREKKKCSVIKTRLDIADNCDPGNRENDIAWEFSQLALTLKHLCKKLKEDDVYEYGRLWKDENGTDVWSSDENGTDFWSLDEKGTEIWSLSVPIPNGPMLYLMNLSNIAAENEDKKIQKAIRILKSKLKFNDNEYGFENELSVECNKSWKSENDIHIDDYDRLCKEHCLTLQVIDWERLQDKQALWHLNFVANPEEECNLGRLEEKIKENFEKIKENNRGSPIKSKAYVQELSHFLIEQGKLYQEYDKHEKAKSCFDEAIRLLECSYPEEIKRYHLQASLAKSLSEITKESALEAKDGSKELALKEAQKARKLDPLSYLEHQTLGEIFCDLEEFNYGLEEYDYALSWKPSDPDILFAIGRNYLNRAEKCSKKGGRKKELELAAKNLNEALELYDKDKIKQRGKTRYCLGKVYLNSGEYYEAIPHFRILYNLKLDKGETGESSSWLISALQLGRAYLHIKAYDECDELFGRIMENFNENELNENKLNELIGEPFEDPMLLGELLAWACLGKSFSFAERNQELGEIKDGDSTMRAMNYLEKLKNNVKIRHLESRKRRSIAQCEACQGLIYYKKDKIDPAIRLLSRSISESAESVSYLHLARAYKRKLELLKPDDKEDMRLFIKRKALICCQRAIDLDFKGDCTESAKKLKEEIGEEDAKEPPEEEGEKATISLEGNAKGTVSWKKPPE